MPLLIAVLVAAAISGLVFGVAARRAHSIDVADIRADATDVAAAARSDSALKRFLVQRRDPDTATGLLLTVAVGAVAAAVIVIGLLLEMVSTHQGFASLDESAARFGAEHATSGTTTALKVVTSFGATWLVTLVVVAVGVHQLCRHRRIAPAIFPAVAVIATVAVGNIVKVLVHRTRPDIAPLVHAAGSSFPSGHSAAAAATWASVALIYGRQRSRRVRAILVSLASAMAVAVATSRVLLGVHWLTDVIAGVLLGWACFALCSIAFGGRIMQFGHPVETAHAAAQTADVSQVP